MYQTRANGCPIADIKNSMTAGPLGPIVMQDVGLLEKLQHFDREKIPARNVHALGTGAYGTFTVTKDVSKWTRASLFSTVC
jgi:catalase